MKVSAHPRLAKSVALIIVASFCAPTVAVDADGGHPLTAKEREQVRRHSESVLRESPLPEDETTAPVALHSRRGDALFFLGDYEKAVEEYRAMVRRDAAVDVGHWRLGIALFFAAQPEAAAAQFDKYHSFDDVDRENGIWRFLSHHRAFGAERAAKELLKYEKDDREPFPAVYRLFDGTLTSQQAVQLIDGTLPPAEKEKRLFYTQLYIGMLKSVQGDTAAAKSALRVAVRCRWPRKAGFGPNYMWHVARLQFERVNDPK